MMSINRYRLKHLENEGHAGAQRVQKLLQRPDRLIGLILIGNNLVNVFASIIAAQICVRLFGDLGVAIAGVALTIILLIFAEVTPKTLAALHPEKISFPSSLILSPLLFIFMPIVVALNWITNGILALFKINPKIYNNYIKILNHYIDNPNKKSLIELCLIATNDKDEILHQIPHFIFPIVGLYIATIPRLLLLLCNHKNDFKKVIQEVYSVNDYNMNNSKEIYKLRFLRKCILETLRLNNPVITTFRTLAKDYTFDNKHSFKKGTQFIILNNPVLREKEFYKQPNKFIPSRWTSEMEKSYYAISFNQGPQRCPGKELVIYLVQSFIYNLIKIKNIGKSHTIVSNKINTVNIPQVINPCNIKFRFVNISI